MAYDGITHFLDAADRVEAEGLVDGSLGEGIGGGGGAGEPGSGYCFVEAGEGEDGGCCGGELGMHEDVGGCDAFDPGGGDGAVQQGHCESHGAFAVCDYVDLLWGVLQVADLFQCGFDIETGVEGRVSLFGEDRFSDTVRDDEDFVTSRSEIFDSVAGDGG